MDSIKLDSISAFLNGWEILGMLSNVCISGMASLRSRARTEGRFNNSTASVLVALQQTQIEQPHGIAWHCMVVIYRFGICIPAVSLMFPGACWQNPHNALILYTLHFTSSYLKFRCVWQACLKAYKTVSQRQIQRILMGTPTRLTRRRCPPDLAMLQSAHLKKEFNAWILLLNIWSISLIHLQKTSCHFQVNTLLVSPLHLRPARIEQNIQNQ